ncbi:hypothetical protein B4U80_07108 [Leptotrombidium deliense]|uniref:Uncharacterized protein n=1 Tax=Leptotrombidium deliense TaxID=299467 RepID=A0A443RZE8_9ACAR|nr:hypothetical protein B4U80_07108 [Leptotrombidium deliense]
MEAVCLKPDFLGTTYLNMSSIRLLVTLNISSS